jgi:hypothetical protein
MNGQKSAQNNARDPVRSIERISRAFLNNAEEIWIGTGLGLSVVYGIKHHPQ